MSRSAFVTCVVLAGGMWWSFWLQNDWDSQPGNGGYAPSVVAGFIAVALSLGLTALALRSFRRAELLWIVAGCFLAGVLVSTAELCNWLARLVQQEGAVFRLQDYLRAFGSMVGWQVREFALAGICWVPMVGVLAAVRGLVHRRSRQMGGAHA